MKYRIINLIRMGILQCLFLFVFCNAQAQSSNIKLGAYYFDGWKKENGNTHLPPGLKQNLDRKPVWGWVTSTQNIMNKQIDAAANAGLSFFSFCWYYNPKKNIDSSNRGLLYYNNSPQKKRLKYCLLVANHTGYEIGPKEWPTVSNEWIKQFKSGTYLLVDGKPLIIFFSTKTLVSKFGTTDGVKAAFGKLKSIAQKSGLNGVTIAACVAANSKEISIAEACGFDVLTGYNYHGYGLLGASLYAQTVPISKMQTAEVGIWNKFTQKSKLPYIPVSTLNWDPRPWATAKNNYAKAPYFSGYSPASVYTSVEACISWIKQHPQNTTRDKVGLLYAWNEYGEGGWLTPSANKTDYLGGVKKALNGE